MGATSNTSENIELGICNITFGGVDMGVTDGSVKATISESITRVFSEHTGGIAPLKVYRNGEGMKATATLMENGWDQLQKVYGSGTLVTDAGDNTKKKLTFGKKTGAAVSTFALTLAAQQAAAGDKKMNLLLYAAFISDPGDWEYAANGARKRQVTFEAIYDASRDDGDCIGCIGYDEAAA